MFTFYFNPIVLCLLWGIFAIRMHFKLGYPTELWRVAIVFVLNMLFAPIAMILAIVRCPIEKQNEIQRKEDEL